MLRRDWPCISVLSWGGGGGGRGENLPPPLGGGATGPDSEAWGGGGGKGGQGRWAQIKRDHSRAQSVLELEVLSPNRVSALSCWSSGYLRWVRAYSSCHCPACC